MESFEEDFIDYKSESISMKSDDINDVGMCSYPESLITGETYNDSDKRFYVFNSGKFLQAKCMNIEDELKASIKSDLLTENISDISNIFTIGTDATSDTGHGCKQTRQVIYKLNFDYPYYITIMSLYRIFKEPSVNKWYMVKLYNGKRKRIHNLLGIRGVSMHHCQVPGYYIYKLFTRQELLSGVNLDASVNDFVSYEQMAYNQSVLDVICRKTQGMTLAEFKSANIEARLEQLTQSIQRVNVQDNPIPTPIPVPMVTRVERQEIQTRLTEDIQRLLEERQRMQTELTELNNTQTNHVVADRVARYRSSFLAKLGNKLNKTHQELLTMEAACRNGHELDANGVCKQKCNNGQSRNFESNRCRIHANNRF
jgi:hypothetical protein